MIHELADYEKESSKVEATEESLNKTLTFAPSESAPKSDRQLPDSSGYASTLILRLPVSLSPEDAAAGLVPGAVAGMALYFNNYSTWRSK